MSKTKRPAPLWRLAVACSALSILLYLNTLDCGFCYDDRAVLVENQDILPSSSWSNLLKNDFWGKPIHLNTSHKSYRPLCVATFRLNYMLHELQPMGYHLVNVLLHGVVCYLYVQLCGVIFSEVWPALIAGLLFAVHPIHTEAVAGIVGRADLLCALFFLLSFLFYHKAAIADSSSTDTRSRGHGYLMKCLVCCLCSVLSKENGITIIGVCLLYDFFVLQQYDLPSLLRLLPKGHSVPQVFKHFIRRAIVLCVFAVAVLGARVWLMRSTPTFSKMDNEALVLDSPYRQLHWAYLPFLNIWLLLNPSHLLHDYRMNAVPLITSFFDSRNILTLINLASLAGLGVYSLSSKVSTNPQTTNYIKSHRNNTSVNGAHKQLCHDSRTVLLFGLSLLVVPFIPASNLFFPVGFVVAERVLYLPSMGFCLLVAYVVYRLIRTQNLIISNIAKLALLLLLVTHSAKTVNRNRDWHSKITIYSSLLRLYPHNGHMLANLAREYRNINNEVMAEQLYRQSMKVAPNVSISFVNFGGMLKKQQRLDEAEVVLTEAIQALEREGEGDLEKVARIYSALCTMASRNSSRFDEALEMCDKAVNTYNMSSAHNSKGALLLKLGRNVDAKSAFEAAIRLDPQNANAYFNLALTFEHMGDTSKAIRTLEHVLTVDSSHQQAKHVLNGLRNNMDIDIKLR